MMFSFSVTRESSMLFLYSQLTYPCRASTFCVLLRLQDVELQIQARIECDQQVDLLMDDSEPLFDQHSALAVDERVLASFDMNKDRQHNFDASSQQLLYTIL